MCDTKIDYKIINYESIHYDGLFRLLEKVYGSHIKRDCLEEEYLSDNRSILLAVETTSDNVLGCAFLEIQKDFIRPNSILYVTYVAVDDSVRKQGIGRRIFEEIEKKCRSFGCTAVELTSADFRKGAHLFYESLGFTRKKTTVYIKEP